MRIVGYVSQYQGDKELKVISYKILKDEPYIYAPKKVDTKTAMDYEALGGSLLETEGKVTRVAIGADGAIEEFWLMDDTGVEAAIFIDGYIKSATTGKNELASFVKEGATVSAVGVLYKHPEGASDVSVPVFRVRNCDDITLVSAAPEVKPQPSQPSFVERVVSGIVNTVRNIVNAIHESPVAQAIRNLFGFKILKLTVDSLLYNLVLNSPALVKSIRVIYFFILNPNVLLGSNPISMLGADRTSLESKMPLLFSLLSLTSISPSSDILYPSESFALSSVAYLRVKS
jgi:hypothetical protein